MLRVPDDPHVPRAPGDLPVVKALGVIQRIGKEQVIAHKVECAACWPPVVRIATVARERIVPPENEKQIIGAAHAS